MKVHWATLVLRSIASAALVIISTFTVSAEIEDKLGLKFYGSFLYTEKVPNALFFFSDIEKNDSFELRKALRNHDIDILVLSSGGGSVWEGLNMAGIIYDKELITYVPELGLDGEGNCASACAFMFFGGSTRIADGKLGVHQFYSGSASESAKIGTTQKVAQFTVSEIIGFLNEFKTPPFVYERMFQQSEMYYFDKKELEKIARVAKPLEQEAQKSISSFINDFKVELALLDVDEDQQETEPVKTVEPKKPPTPKKKTPVVTERTKPKEVVEPKIVIPTVQKPVKTKVEIVKGIQTELNRLNCSAGTPDGVIGNRTRSALKRYASASGKVLGEDLLTKQQFLNELESTNIKCKTIKANLICSGKNKYTDKLKKVTIYDFLRTSLYSKKYKIEICYLDGSCEVGNFERSEYNGLTHVFNREYGNQGKGDDQIVWQHKRNADTFWRTTTTGCASCFFTKWIKDALYNCKLQ